MLIGMSHAAAQNQFNKKLELNLGEVQAIDSSGQQVAESTIKIKDNTYQPATLTVATGSTVTWHNQDAVQHSVTSDVQGVFDSGSLSPGKKFSHTFNSPGSYGYHSNIGPAMQGTIIVTGSASSPTALAAAGKLSSASLGSMKGSSGESDSASWSEQPISEKGASAPGNTATKLIKLNLTSNLGQAGSQAQATGNIAMQQFAQYYSQNKETSSEPITAPQKIDLNGLEPSTLYFGSSQKAVPYSQYKSYALTGGLNSLWIQGSSSWTQYAVVPLGSTLSLVGISSAGGYGSLYEIYPDGTLDTNGYYFYPYNQLGFYADQVGQHLLFFNIGGQPSNVVVVDVQQYQSPTPPSSYAMVTVQSGWLRNYDVYLDGIYQATEGTTGEPDGVVTLYVPANQYHTVAVSASGFTFSDYKYFNAGWEYTLNI